jgi:hypothetical protein
MAATRPAHTRGPRLKTVQLREDWHAPSRSPLKVDREKGIIHRIKVCGWESLNSTNGLKRRYLPEAGRNALHLYEGAKAYSNHPPHGRPEQTRVNDDALGIWHDPVWESDGVYADLHYLKSHPMAERVCEDAERGLGVFGASHNADGMGDTQGGEFVISNIIELRSVDVVTDPATVKNLWEGRKIKVKIADHLLEHVLPKLDLDRAKRLKTLCEAMGDGKTMEPGSDAKDHKDHLYNAMRACEEQGDDNMAGKIHSLMKPDKKEENAAADVEGDAQAGSQGLDDAEDGTMKNKEKDVEEDSDELRGKNQKGQMRAMFAKDGGGSGEESRRRKPPAAGVAVLTEARAKALCKLAGLAPTVDILESVVGTPEAQAINILALLKGGTQDKKNAPRSQGQGRTITEGREAFPKTAAEQAVRLLS